MQVCVSAAAPFYAFDLARELYLKGHLERLYTGYPKSRAFGIPPAKVSSYPWTMGPQIASSKSGWAWGARKLQHWSAARFDDVVARRLQHCDVFHAMSSFAIKSHRTAKSRYGCITICDRGSSHIMVQRELLREEHARWNVPFAEFDQRVVDRELAEYEVCDRIVVPSTFARRSFINSGVTPQKVVQIPFGADLSAFRPHPKEDDKFRVIYVGQISLQKGVVYLLEAVKQLGGPAAVELWLIGAVAPEMRDILPRYSGLFTAKGVIPRRDLSWYYSQGSVLVHPSIQEGLALVQAQAMACELPIIGTTNSGAEDLITDGSEGYVVPIRDAKAIADRLIRLRADDRLRRAMGVKAREKLRAWGGWKTYVERICQMYNDCSRTLS